jgi:DNA (cytosine-5)-methyltransferase 1
MRVLSRFSGIGGLDLAAEWAGMETVAFCEREPFCQKVLKKHWPDIPCFDDVKTLKGSDVGTVDVITGGYPCQPFSVAGKRKGKDDERYLWPEFSRLIDECQPSWVIGENVAGHITSGLDAVCDDLESKGYAVQAFVFPACAVGANHERQRCFVVAHNDQIRGSQRNDDWRRGDLSGLDWKTEKANSKRQRLNGTWENGSVEYVANADKLQRNGGDYKPECKVSEPGNGSCAENVSDSTSGRQQGQRESINASNCAAHGKRKAGHAFNVCIGNQWATEPAVGRVANGVPSRVDRLRGLGNAVVPQQAYPIFKAIMEIERMAA